MKQPLLMIGASVLSVVIIVAFLGSIIRPDASVHASQQNRMLAKMPPLSKVQFLKVRKNIILPNQPLRKRILMGGQESSYQMVPFHDYTLSTNAIELDFNDESVTFHLADVLYPLDAETLRALYQNPSAELEFYDLDNQEVKINIGELSTLVQENAIIEKTFVLGTDALGRDLLSRLMAGSAISLLIGFLAVLISLTLGLSIGIFAGYYGGIIDRILSWIINLFWSIPAILLAILITFSMGGGTVALILGVSSVLWVEMAQIIRKAVQSEGQKEYINAARLLGLSHWQVLRRHVFPNILSPVFVLVASTFADAIILESGLSFLGIGIRPPQPSWGNMIRESYGYIISEGSAYLALVPALALVIVVMAFMFVANGLKQALAYSINQARINRV